MKIGNKIEDNSAMPGTICWNMLKYGQSRPHEHNHKPFRKPFWKGLWNGSTPLVGGFLEDGFRENGFLEEVQVGFAERPRGSKWIGQSRSHPIQ